MRPATAVLATDPTSKIDRPTGLRRFLPHQAADAMSIPEDCFLYPPANKGRRLGKGRPSPLSLIDRNPVDGRNCISEDFFVKPGRKTDSYEKVTRDHIKEQNMLSHIDTDEFRTRRPSKPLPELNAEKFNEICSDTAAKYSDSSNKRAELKLKYTSTNSKLIEALSWNN